MKFRQRLFWILAILVVAYVVATLASTEDVYENAVTEGAEERTELEQSARETGAALGVAIGSTIVLCVGIPLALGFSLLAWRNGVGLREKRRQEELEDFHQRAIEAYGGNAMQANRTEWADEKPKRPPSNF